MNRCLTCMVRRRRVLSLPNDGRREAVEVYATHTQQGAPGVRYFGSRAHLGAGQTDALRESNERTVLVPGVEARTDRHRKIGFCQSSNRIRSRERFVANV